MGALLGLEPGGVGPVGQDTIVGLGRVGWVGRGLMMAVVGWFVLQAAITFDPDEAKGIDGALREVTGSSLGSLLVGFVVGIAATLVAALVGLASAFFGRTVDDVLSLVTNVFLLNPGLPLLVLLAALHAPGASRRPWHVGWIGDRMALAALLVIGTALGLAQPLTMVLGLVLLAADQIVARRGG